MNRENYLIQVEYSPEDIEFVRRLMERKLKVSLVPREVNGLKVIITSKEIPRVYNFPSDSEKCFQKLEELVR